jgi:hypothetical protein
MKRDNAIKRYPGADRAVEDRLLDRNALKKRWGKSLETLKRLERTGVLKPLKLGAKVSYRLSDVVAAEQEAEVV